VDHKVVERAYRRLRHWQVDLRGGVGVRVRVRVRVRVKGLVLGLRGLGV